MTSEKLDEKAIFNIARNIASPEARTKYLHQICGSDGNLIGRIETLLIAYNAQASFLESPAVSLPATTERWAIAEQPGAVIGPYKLLQQIGEGGMGVVFMAEQSEPIQRTVALKIIKPGMDTRQVIARFEAERQALALMDHPNIARVLDVGATDAGLPYFVMDLVKGVPIIQYCDQQHLSIRDRLELMADVCHAVQHAHQKGIIHRDLKPSNVLVAEYDGHPVPKIIDFGVAKATAQRLTERTLFTEYGQLVGTFEYMSPEQARFNQLDVDTRSDIYSLGVLLYELMTGSTPLEKDRLHTAAFDEILRLIGEEEPPPPSTRLSSSRLLPSISAQRHSEPAKLTRLVRGELDWIVMRCLEKDRNRRYETASALGADLQRYLADEPVEARPTSHRYRLMKFARRHRVGVLAGTAIVAALALGLTVATIGLVQARRQAAIAAAQVAKATATNNLLQDMLKSANPSASKGKEYTVRQMLLDFSAQLDDQIRSQPEVEASIRATIGHGLMQLDHVDEAEPHLRKALEIRRRLFGEEHSDVANSYNDIAWVAHYGGNYAEAEKQFRKSLAIYSKLRIENADNANALYGLGLTLGQLMRYPDAEAVYEEAYDMARKQGAEDDLSAILYGQANLALATPGNAVKAEQLARESLALQRRFFGSNHPSLAWTLWTLGTSLDEQDNLVEAEQCLREAIAIFIEVFGDGHFLVHNLRFHLRTILINRGDKAALVKLDAELGANRKAALADFDKAVAAHPNRPYQLAQRGYINALQGNFEKAEADLTHAAKLGPQFSSAIMMRAALCLTRDDVEGFRRASQEMADVAAEGSDHLAIEYAVGLFTMMPDSGIEPRQALKFAQQLIESDPEDAYWDGLLGGTLFRAGRYEEAAQKLTEAFGEGENDYSNNGIGALGHLLLAMTHHRLGHAKEAGEWFNRAEEGIKTNPGQIAYWPYSMIWKRLHEETKATLGGEREEQPAKPLRKSSPTTQGPPAGEAQPVDDQTPKANN